jgi:hypothetical protein
MTSKAKKGSDFQRWTQKLLEEHGWEVHNQPRSVKWIKDKKTKELRPISVRNDILGCIDLVAKKEKERTLWIQCTLHSGKGKKEEDLKEIPWNYEVDNVQIWMDRGSRKVDIFQLDPFGDFVLVGRVIKRKFHKIMDGI